MSTIVEQMLLFFKAPTPSIPRVSAYLLCTIQNCACLRKQLEYPQHCHCTLLQPNHPINKNFYSSHRPPKPRSWQPFSRPRSKALSQQTKANQRNHTNPMQSSKRILPNPGAAIQLGIPGTSRSNPLSTRTQRAEINVEASKSTSYLRMNFSWASSLRKRTWGCFSLTAFGLALIAMWRSYFRSGHMVTGENFRSSGFPARKGSMLGNLQERNSHGRITQPFSIEVWKKRT